MADNNRDASTGPWVSVEDKDKFLEFCKETGHETKEHSNPFTRGYMVRHKGHWMAILYNKNWKRYTADKRLSLIVQSFAAGKTRKDGV